MSNTSYPIPIIRTKLYRPPVTADYLARGALENRLDQGAALPLTVVSAPAGYGKSTLISHWLETRKSSSAWLSLGEADSDLTVFLTYFVTAVRAVSPGACENVLAILAYQDLPPLPVIVAHFSNDLNDLEDSLVLVLDDYHHIHEIDIHLLLDRLLEHPSPNFQLIILSRRDPGLSLTSLRAGHLLNEIRIRDLEFSSEETVAFFSQVIDQPIAPEVIRQFQETTGGWPAAVRLATLALRNHEDAESFLTSFGANTQSMRDYLVSEVLLTLPSWIAAGLLKCSIFDRFTASLVDTVLDNGAEAYGSQSRGEAFIEAIQASGLFCIALDGQGMWFRFHQLFRDLIGQRLEDEFSREEISDLHRKASRWFGDSGYPEEAIGHALAAHDEKRAADILGASRHDLMKRDQWQRLEMWLKLFTDQAVRRLPQLQILRCWLDHSYLYLPGALARDLDHIENALDQSNLHDEPEIDLLRDEIGVLRGTLAYWAVNPELTITLTEPMLGEPSGKREYVKGTAVLYHAAALQQRGEAIAAEQFIKGHIEDDITAGPALQGMSLLGLCFVYWCEADTRKLQKTASRLMDLSREHDLTLCYSYSRYFLGLAHYERNELREAVAQLEEIVNAPYRYPIHNVTHCSFLLSLSFQTLGEPDKARATADAINRFTLERRNRNFIDLAEAFQAELDLRQGLLAPAIQWARNSEFPAEHAFQRYFNAEFTMIKAYLGEATMESLAEAADKLELLTRLTSRNHAKRLQIDLLGLKALHAIARNDSEAAVAFLEEAVTLGRPGNLIRPLADMPPGFDRLLHQIDLDQEGLQYVGRILSARKAISDSDDSAIQADNQPLSEPLSQRELEILNLFAQRMNNKEIADRLFISAGTVKRHAHNIHGKLSVNSRRDAVAKAIGLGILKPR